MTKIVSSIQLFVVTALLMLIGCRSALSNDWVFDDAMEDIIDQVNDGSGQALTDAVDIDALLIRVFENLEVSDRLKAGFSQSIKANNNLGKNIVRGMPDGSYAKVLDVDRDGDTATALVRYDFGGRGFGYHKYDLVLDEAGAVRIVDWLDYLDGFRYSDALKLSLVTNGPTAESVRGLVPDHQGSEEEFAKFAEVISSYRRQDYKKFYSDSASLSRKLRQTRLMHLLTAIVSQISRDKNLQNDAFRDLSSNFGDDPQVVLTLLNYYYKKGDSDEAFAALRLLQEDFGVRDAALLALMARTALGMRNTQEATLLADEAVSIEPEFEPAYWAAIDAHATLNHHTIVVMTAKSLEEQFGKSLDQQRFENNGRYASLIQSPQFREWQGAKQLQ